VGERAMARRHPTQSALMVPVMVESQHGSFTLRENPMLVARVRQYRRLWS